MVKVGAIVQVRLGSERLPGKALLPLPFGGDTSLLEHVVANARAAQTLHQTVIATTTHSADDAIEVFCSSRGLDCLRGSADDVLERFRQAAHAHQLDVIVRLTGDNPFVMPGTIDYAVTQLLDSKADYIITTGLPLGTNVEVFTRQALEKAASEATQSTHREHVTPYIRREAGFKSLNLPLESPISGLRLTVDYPTDYALASLLFGRLRKPGQVVTHQAIAELLQEHPWLQEVNAANAQRQAFGSEEEELAAAREVLKSGGFTRAVQKLR